MTLSAGQRMFAHQVERDDDAIDLAVAALLIGEIDGGSIDVAHYLSMLDEFAGVARRYLRGDPGPFAAVRALNRALFGELGFRGNQDDYYDPRNSFLDQVIDTRRGIPISLSVLYIEVAARIDLEIHGVGFPGHFLVRYDGEEEPLVLDPFRLGLILDKAALTDLLRRASGATAQLTPELLAPTPKKQILFRMLGNLATIYSRRADLPRSIDVLERMRILTPGDAKLGRELDKLRARLDELN